MLDKEFHIRFTLSDVGKALCFSPVVVVLLYLLICLPWGSNNAAAWVQAVGSVLAILVAIYISHQERLRLEKERKLETERRSDERLYEAFHYLDTAWRVAAYASEVVKGAAKDISKGDITPRLLEFHRSMLIMSASDLEGIDFTRIQNPVAEDAFLGVKRVVTLSLSTIQMKIAESDGKLEPSKDLDWGEIVDANMDKILEVLVNWHPRLRDEFKFPG